MIIKRNKQFSWFSNLFKKKPIIQSPAKKRSEPLSKTEIEDLLKTKPESHLYVSEKEKADIKKISPQHRILIEIFDKVEKSRPTWEFLEEVGPQFSFIEDIGDEEDEEIELKLDNQSGNVYRWTGKYWEEINNSHPPRKIQNLKQELLKELSEYRKEWDKEDEDTGRSIVLNYIDHLEQEIKKSRL